ncbi:hypothetical protein V1478_016181 [Vespula squamosa]|uniref:Uncharacterized protein n=1 Tax=Vespula squamosa TaxID=30214 RepID=A0ABD1ZZ31_VESSQ
MGWAIQCHRDDGPRFLQNYLRCASSSSFFESEKMLVFVFIARTVKEKEVKAVSRKDRKKGGGGGEEGGGGGRWVGRRVQGKDGASNAKGMQEIASPLPLLTSPCLSPSTITTTTNTTPYPPSTSPYSPSTSNSFPPFPFPQTFLSSVEAKTSSESF